MDYILFCRDDYDHGVTYYADFIKNYKADKVYTEACYNDVNSNKIKKLAKSLRLKIQKSFENIKLDEEHVKLEKSSKENICRYLYDEIFLKKIYDQKFLKFLILICNKHEKSFEILMLCRYLIDRCKSSITLDILLYNHLLKSIYCAWGNLDELQKSPRSHKIYKRYPEVKNLYGYKIYFGEKNIEKFYMDPEDTVRPILYDLSNCRFYDEYKKEYLGDGGDWEEETKLMKKIRQDLKDFYIGNVKWINQHLLFKNTEKIFQNSNTAVFREYSPKYLGLQRFDVYFEINNKKIAFEYQGEQHFKPIDFFGGQKGLDKRKALDLKKKNKCKRHSVNLIEFHYSEKISVNSILHKLKENNINIQGENICLRHLN